jgi:replication-associated recombination protein RarA
MNHSIPLAERLRPQSLKDLVGQEHLSSEESVLQKAITKGKVPSMILWGPPGVGKTTLANIIATTFNSAYYQLSAISSGVKELREVIEEAKSKTSAILFIDEIHRFNKGQQDALLGAVEKGTITPEQAARDTARTERIGKRADALETKQGGELNKRQEHRMNRALNHNSGAIRHQRKN